MAIKKLEEIRLNVQPVSIEFVHEYVFEGPCRFGKGDALTKPFDEMINEEKFQDFCDMVSDALQKKENVTLVIKDWGKDEIPKEYMIVLSNKNLNHTIK